MHRPSPIEMKKMGPRQGPGEVLSLIIITLPIMKPSNTSDGKSLAFLTATKMKGGDRAGDAGPATKAWPSEIQYAHLDITSSIDICFSNTSTLAIAALDFTSGKSCGQFLVV